MREVAKKRVEAYVWWCGDYVCDCTEPVIELVRPHPNDFRFVQRQSIWQGTFRTDSEPGAYAELMKVRRAMKRAGWDVDQIKWQPAL